MVILNGYRAVPKLFLKLTLLLSNVTIYWQDLAKKFLRKKTKVVRLFLIKNGSFALLLKNLINYKNYSWNRLFSYFFTFLFWAF